MKRPSNVGVPEVFGVSGSRAAWVRWSPGTNALALAATALLFSACATQPPVAYRVEVPPGVTDARGRFSEIYCEVLERHGTDLPDYRPCEEALSRVTAPPPGTGRPVELGPSKRRLVAGFVPGIGYACFAPWLQPPTTPAEHARKYGYDLRVISVDALSSTVTNARQIRDAVMTMPVEPGPPRLVLIGYSKGTLDILDAVVRYPEIRGRVAAVVSIAGAVGGSVLARDATQQQLDLLRYWPDANCEAGDGEGVASLRPDARKAWFAQNTLPPNLRYYSVVTLPDRARISRLVVPGYRTLSQIDPRNDGQVIYSDQFVPGSTLLGFLNADHWAVLVPVARSHAVIGGLFVDQNDYPREALLEAVLRFVEEDLSRKRIDHPRTPRKLGIALKRKMIQSMSYSPATAGCVRSVRPMPTTPGPASQGRSRPQAVQGAQVTA